jgi:hypothetical protein
VDHSSNSASAGLLPELRRNRLVDFASNRRARISEKWYQSVTFLQAAVHHVAPTHTVQQARLSGRLSSRQKEARARRPDVRTTAPLYGKAAL